MEPYSTVRRDRLNTKRTQAPRVWRGIRIWLTLILLCSTLLLTGCDPSGLLGWLMFGPLRDPISGNNHARRYMVDLRPIKIEITGRETPEVAPGGGGARVFEAQGNQAGLIFIWWPPEGARDFDFREGSEPHPGGPPFIWDGVPNGGIAVFFEYAPTYDPGITELTDTFAAVGVDAYYPYEKSAVVATTKIVQTGGNGLANAGMLHTNALPTATSFPVAPISDTIEAWQVIRSFTPKNTLTTARCQELVDFIQDENAFLALRLPVSPTTFITQTAAIPFYLGEPYSNTFRVATVIPTSSTHITVPLGLRRERLDFAANHLPQAAGELWVTLGGWGEALTCPPDLNTPAGNWLMRYDILLDLSGQPNNCADCVQPGYYCYEGQELPAAASLLTRLDSVTYQGEGITCIGPDITDLDDTSSWTLGGAGVQVITPTQVISMPHFIYLQEGGSMTLTMDISSTLGVTWGLYQGSSNAPNLAAPIDLPWTVTGFEYFWLVSSAVPATTTHGNYSVFVSASEASTPTNARYNSDMLWVGDWIAPPPATICNPPASVTLTGPATAVPSTTTTLTATVTPLTDTAILPLTTPLVYTWEATGQPVQTHTSNAMLDTAVFTWTTPGPQIITITVDSPCLATVSDTHAISVAGEHRLYLPLVLRSTP